jgi:hypothetical protein
MKGQHRARLCRLPSKREDSGSENHSLKSSERRSEEMVASALSPGPLLDHQHEDIGPNPIFRGRSDPSIFEARHQKALSAFSREPQSGKFDSASGPAIAAEERLRQAKKFGPSETLEYAPRGELACMRFSFSFPDVRVFFG